MKFRKVNYFDNRTGKEAVLLNRKLEFLHHYWSFVLDSKTTLMLLKEERLESHRSLLKKIGIQLLENRIFYPKRLFSLFVSHAYFQSDNIIISQNSSLSKAVAELASHCRTVFIRKQKVINKDEQGKYIIKIQHEISKISDLILGKKDTLYVQNLLNCLTVLLHEATPLLDDRKKDLKFLINAIIIELYEFGYSIEYLKKLPDILLFPKQNEDEFPYRKSYDNFEIEDDFKAYKLEELSGLNLQKQILSLDNLIRRPKRKGFYIFKINNLSFQDEPLKIQGLTFYNPVLNKMLNSEDASDEYKSYFNDIELYFGQENDAEPDKKVKSECNVIIPVQYRPLFWNKPDNSIRPAIFKAIRSLEILKRFKYYYVGGCSNFAAIDSGTYIVTNSKLEYRSAPRFRDDDYFDEAFQIPIEKRRIMRTSLAWVNKLNSKNDLHRKVMDISSTSIRYLLHPESFSFKEFWINVCDPLFPNNVAGIIEFAKKCVRRHVQEKYATSVKIFLSESFKAAPFDGNGNYCLDEAIFNKLGLGIKYLVPISSKKFSRVYKQLAKHINSELLEELLFDIDQFSSKTNEYLEQADQWVERIMLESYAERNLEIHNNLSTDISRLKLGGACIQITNIILLTFSAKMKKQDSHVTNLII